MDKQTPKFGTAITIDAIDLPDYKSGGKEIEAELEAMEVSTHYSNTLFYASKSECPHFYQWLLDNGVKEPEVEKFRTEPRIACGMWGT